jgi:hypothetical protein
LASLAARSASPAQTPTMLQRGQLQQPPQRL